MTRERPVRSLLVAGVVLLAGCGAAVGSDPPPRDTVTAVPVPTTGEDYPPGIGESGVSPSSVAAAHDRALDGTSFTFVRRHRVVAANGTVWTTDRERRVAADGTYAGRSNRTASEPPLQRVPPVRFAYWTNGTATAYYRESSRGPGTYAWSEGRPPVVDVTGSRTVERLFGTVDAAGSLTPGAVHHADGGTLLIEDVDALSPALQSSLLHLLESGEVVPEGGTDAVPVDVRLLATTTEDLDEQVRNDNFRPALAERLHVLSLHMPPLRERRADIPLLVRHFLDVLRPGDSTMVSITQPAMEALLRYDWPGNVRQLRNELERAIVHVSSEPAPTIDRTVLLDAIVDEAQNQESLPADDSDAILHPNQTLSDVLSRREAAIIKRVLRACDGQVTASADVLGLSRQGLYKKMKRLNIDASTFQSDADPEPTPAP